MRWRTRSGAPFQIRRSSDRSRPRLESRCRVQGRVAPRGSTREQHLECLAERLDREELHPTRLDAPGASLREHRTREAHLRRPRPAEARPAPPRAPRRRGPTSPSTSRLRHPAAGFAATTPAPRRPRGRRPARRAVIPPATFTNDVAADQLDVLLLLQHRRQQRHPVAVHADRRAPRGAVARWARPAPAPRPAAAGCPLSVAVTTEPGLPGGPLGEEERGRVRHLRQPRALHLEDADLVGASRSGSCARGGCGTGGRARPRSRGPCPPCARAPAARRWLPSLVTWPTRNVGTPERLAKPSAARRPRGPG